jgi:hypothetical protein
LSTGRRAVAGGPDAPAAEDGSCPSGRDGEDGFSLIELLVVCLVAYLKPTSHSETECSVTTVATDGTELTISRDARGVIERTCRSAGKAGCSEGVTGGW